MERLNATQFIGNVGQIKIGEKSVYLAVAINESYKPKNETEWVENTVWLDCVGFGTVIEKIKKSGIAKGDAVLILGKLGTREYEGKRYTQVIIQKAQLISKPKNSSQSSAGNEPPSNEDASDKESKAPSNGDDDQDLPF